MELRTSAVKINKLGLIESNKPAGIILIYQFNKGIEKCPKME